MMSSTDKFKLSNDLEFADFQLEIAQPRDTCRELFELVTQSSSEGRLLRGICFMHQAPCTMLDG